MSGTSRPAWWSAIALRAAALGAFAIVVLSFAGPIDSRFDLFADFRAGLAAGVALLAIAALLLRERFLLVLMGIAFVADALPIARLYVGATTNAATASGEPLRVVLFNVQVDNPQKPEVARFVADSNADLVVIQESTDELSDLIVGTGAFELVIADFRKGIDAKRSSALYRRRDSKCTTIESELIRADSQEFGMGFLRGRFALLGKGFTVVVPRFPTPLTSHRRTVRGRFFERVEELVKLGRSQGDEVLVVSDLNTTPFASDFASFLRATNLHDSTRGFGYQPTWPAVGMLRFVKIPIDHLLHSDGFVVRDRRVASDSHHSDHFPVTFDLVLGMGP